MTLDRWNVARFLVVDDEPLICLLLEEWLLELGHEIVGPANSVQDALDLIDHGSIDGAILDLSLGNENGYSVADVLAERGIPFAFATGYGTTRLEPRFTAQLVLSKPFTLDAIKEAAHKLLQTG